MFKNKRMFRGIKIKVLYIVGIFLMLFGVVMTIYAATPIANAGPDEQSGVGDFLQLDGTASTGDDLQFNWVQIAGAPVAFLNGADSATPTFFYPDETSLITFELTVTDVNGVSDSDTVTIFVELRALPGSLKSVPVFEPENLMDYIQDKDAAIEMGKSLFWDMQVGSDGIQACASCHYSAGVDNRATNRLNPGADGAFQVAGPNETLTLSDFPFHKLSDPLDRNSTILFDSDDVAGGVGVIKINFNDIILGDAEDEGTLIRDPVFHVNFERVRQVTGRDTPTVINAIFNVRSFWDGRANFVFNGVNPFGRRDSAARILEVQTDGSIDEAEVRLEFSSLASQVVGPPLSGVEMSWIGRSFPDLGKKMLSLRPLAQQEVHSGDSVLGGSVHSSGLGLDTTYADMIMAAFQADYWNSNKIIMYGSSDAPLILSHPGRSLNLDEYTLMEANFSLFMGLAIQMYEATLISDDAPFDRYMEGNHDALTEEELAGLNVFVGAGKCVLCHSGAEFTSASVSHTLIQSDLTEEEITERMLTGNGLPAVYDNGFYNIGVRPEWEDIGTGGTDPFGNPLSFVGLAQLGVDIGAPFRFGTPGINPDERIAADGAFKVPTLRNIELTAPYFHNGGMATLEQVVEFYARGSDFHDENMENLAPNIHPLNIDANDRANLVAFLKSLTDERVYLQQAPFDHPQLFIPNGGFDRRGVDLYELAAVGAAGGPPLQAFVDIHSNMEFAFSSDKTIVNEGETVEFTLTVTNAGDNQLDNDFLDSSLDCDYGDPQTDLWASGVLDLGEIWTFTCSMVFTADATESVTFTMDDKLNNQLSDSDSISIDVISPGISISLSPDAQEVASGSDATLTIEVTNNGDVALTDVSVTSALVPDCDASLGVLAALATTSYTCTVTNVTASFTVEAEATGESLLGDILSDSVSAEVYLEGEMPPDDPRGTPPPGGGGRGGRGRGDDPPWSGRGGRP